jgi:hypothetical protein
MSRPVTALAVIALCSTGAPGFAQSAGPWRSVEVSRQLRDTLPQRIRVRYGAGKVDVRGSTAPLLYAMRLRYDESRSSPLHHYDAEQRSAVLGLESRGTGIRTSNERNETGELMLALPRTVPLDLSFELGGTQSELELGGLSLQSLRLECGATDATLKFTTPNRTRMREMEIDAGAADFTAEHLANANAENVRLRGGVGVVDLDFSGAWTHDMNVSARLAIGKLILRVPADVGVRLEVQRVAAGFEHPGLIERDDAWYSTNWETSRRKLHVRAETFFGKIDVRRAER